MKAHWRLRIYFITSRVQTESCVTQSSKTNQLIEITEEDWLKINK